MSEQRYATTLEEVLALRSEVASLRADRDKWHRVAMDAGAVTCVDGSHLFPLKDEVKNLREQLVKAREALQFIKNGYERSDISHVEFRVRATQASIDALAALTDEEGKS